MQKNKAKSFTLIEVIVVMGIMGLVAGGLIVSLRQVIESEILLKKMQQVEEESRFIMDAFAQDAEYSDLDSGYKPTSVQGDLLLERLSFRLVEKKSDVEAGSSVESVYSSYKDDQNYYLLRTITTHGITPVVNKVTFNFIPLDKAPLFRVRRIESPDGVPSYFITISLIYRVDTKVQPIYIPIETSAISRTFEF